MESLGEPWSNAWEIAAEIRPMLLTEIHILLSALFVIYTGSHASLARPASAAKPAKRLKQLGDEDEDEEPSEDAPKMEGLSAVDALMFPILAGCTLAGLYFIIKWLDDPAILNMCLNWYFTVFGVFGLAKLFTDAMGVVTSVVFPSKYSSDNQLWEIKSKLRIATNTQNPTHKRSSPLPGKLSKLRLPPKAVSALWTLRELPSDRIHIRAYIHRLVAANVRIGPQGCFSFVLALAATLYFNLIAKPWWLTNVLGYSFAYAFLQLVSPSTFSTGSLILAALFVYDIYFVFFTPLMITVATQLDIPAKMLFPRPSSPKDDPAKQPLSMLGLGDIVLPGLVMGFALRFDLYLFYLKKQKRRSQADKNSKSNIKAEAKDATNTSTDMSSDIVKAEYRTATGGWGERFWTGKINGSEDPIHGGVFPKTYFYASMCGYVAGMTATLIIMSIFDHGQPALLYLVPGVLGSLWTTALIKGDLKTMWHYDETGSEDAATDKPSEPKKSLKSIFSSSRQDGIGKRLQGLLKEDDEKTSTVIDGEKDSEEKFRKGGFVRDRKTELVFFSINLPKSLTVEELEEEQDSSPENEPKSKPSIEDELKTAFESDMADTPPSTRTRSMRKSMLNGDVEPPVKRIKRL